VPVPELPAGGVNRIVGHVNVIRAATLNTTSHQLGQALPPRAPEPVPELPAGGVNHIEGHVNVIRATTLGTTSRQPGTGTSATGCRASP
jgi:hypothetical protein